MVTPDSQPHVRTVFKTPEGRYKLSREKTHPWTHLTSFLRDQHHESNPLEAKIEAWQVTLAHLKDIPAQTPPTSKAIGVRVLVSRLLGSAKWGRELVSGAGNDFIGRLGGVPSKTIAIPIIGLGINSGPQASSYDMEGTYIIVNVANSAFISDYNTQDKDPVKWLQFSHDLTSHTFDPYANDGHDLLIGLASGGVYSASLRRQLQDPGNMIVGATHYNKDGSINGTGCTSLAWVPEGKGQFVSAHLDGNLYIYDRDKADSNDVMFSPVKDTTSFSVAHAKSSKSNPIARWHICCGAINEVAFSTDGMYLAAVGRDGYLRVYDYAKELLVCGCKSYFSSLLCCAWSPDGKYILTGGEDDLVQVWSMEEQRVVAWGEGHNSWVSSVAFDPHWSSPTSQENGESLTYRFGSVGQDTQLLLWDLVVDDVVAPFRRLTVSKLFAEGQSSHGKDVPPFGTLYPAPSRKEVPKLAPVMAQQVHAKPLAGLIFAKEAIVTTCCQVHVKIWDRPQAEGENNNPASSSDNALPLTNNVPSS